MVILYILWGLGIGPITNPQSPFMLENVLNSNKYIYKITFDKYFIIKLLKIK